MRASSRRVGLAVVVFIALCAPFSSSAVASRGGAPDLRSAFPSTGTLLTVRFPVGACGSRRTPAFVTVTDRQKRPLARVRITVQAGTRISPAIGVTDATGKLTLMIRPNPFRRGALTLTATARPTDRPAVTKQLALPAC